MVPPPDSPAERHELAVHETAGALFDDEWRERVRELTNGGVDLVIDPVGGDRFTDSLRALRAGGRVVVVGFTGGSTPQVKVNRLLLHNTEVIGAAWPEWVIQRPDTTRTIGRS